MTQPRTIEEQSRISNYLARKGTVCPVCGSNDLYADSGADLDTGYAYQTIDCLSCNSKWTDEYKLVDIQIHQNGLTENQEG